MSSRALAISVLCHRQKSGHPVDQVLEEELTGNPLPVLDRQLAMAIVFGVLRQQRYLDYLLARSSRHPLDKMKDLTLQALRVGLFQLIFMDKIPASAAVNETIKALRSARQPQWLTGFVNGLLRTLARQTLSRTPWLDGRIAPDIALSHPSWLFSRWRQRFGMEQATSICLHNNSHPSLCLHVNSHRISRQAYIALAKERAVTLRPGALAPQAVVLDDYSSAVTALPGFGDGLFLVQDEGAQLIAHLFHPCAPGLYLDACAGLGGKTLQLALLLPPGSQVIAIEPNRHRFSQLLNNISRLGLNSLVSCHNTSLEDFAARCTLRFQGVLLDAPCSGLGVIRRQPDIRWNRGAEDLPRYQQRQLHLLAVAVPLVAPGGSLLYATCSTEPEENEEVARAFLRQHCTFSPAGSETVASCLQNLVHEQGYLQLLPEQGHDAFFAVKFQQGIKQG